MMPTPEKLESTLQKIRPFLQVDGGDVQLAGISADGIVEVRLLGACLSCPMSIMTLRAGIERAIFLDHQDVKRVEQVK
jgi:Fe-S cluster biogenesis protein NfuA